MNIRRGRPAHLEISISPNRKPVTKTLVSPGSATPEAETLPQCSVGQQLERVLAAMELLTARLDQFQAGSSGNGGGKEWYTTIEFAALKGVEKANYTVREWCRWGRVNAVKAKCGRGIDGEWRISHAEYVRYLNEGLLPLPRHNRSARL